ncbi:putative NRPS-like protein biosynthetic cluster [Orbilia oligospora]|uniref:Putative NRPS-like protein biosynthetic cluster n=1 Tax=Orbilia oligospora TaxID=2813651 RepID=A0A8H2DT55_ORBOL|nr:putative NRPS-like protein biosynthetic cluster [Orbilia oligospora]
MSTLRRPYTSSPELPTCGLIELFLNRVIEFPEKLAVIDGNIMLTYRQLLEKVKQFAFVLRNSREIMLEEPIAILTSKGLDHIISQMAIIFCGGTCLPLDPTWSDEQLKLRQSDTGFKIVIADEQNIHRPSAATKILIFYESLDKVKDYQGLSHIPTSSKSRSHILFSSGTTGVPKGIQVAVHGIHRLNFWFQFKPSDRIAHVNNVVFDACIQDIWCPLISGGTVINIPKELMLDPFKFAEAIKAYRITWVLLTNALFNAIAIACPTAFETVDIVVAAGDAPNTSVMKLVIERGAPGRLLNGYGPSECSILSSTYDVTLEDATLGTMSIGRPLLDGDYHVLDENLRPVAGTDVGELYISGPGLSPGYLNRPDLNEKSFLNLRNLTHGGPLRVYKTGDLVRRREGSDLLEYVGRRDNQIKLSGHRIELEVIEAFLAGTGLVSAAAVIKIQPREVESPAFLQAYVVLNPLANLDSLARKVREKYPENLVPRLTPVDRFPLTPNGKTDRKALEALCLESIEQDRLKIKGNIDISSKNLLTVDKLKLVWSEILLVPLEEIKPTDTFFSLGGSSINIASLISEIYKKFNFNISVRDVYEHQTLQRMSSHIESDFCPNTKTANSKDVRNYMINDPKLADELVPLPGPISNWRCTEEGDVLLTGATGFLGAFFLQALIELPEIQTVRCLVRAKDSNDGQLRIRKNLQKYHISIADSLMASKLTVLSGDLAEPLLGLTPGVYEEVARSCATVFHLGAHVNYIQPYTLHRPANIVGTLNILRLAVTGRKKTVHYSSSIGAYGAPDPTASVKNLAEYLPEDEPLDAFINGLVYDLGYSQSQFATEQLVWRAIQRGLPISIYRPGFILGHSKTGYGNPHDFFGRVAMACIKMGYYPLLPKQRNEFIPVDQVVKQLLHISSNHKNIGHAYNLVPLRNSESVELNDTFEMLSRCVGVKLKGLPYQEWLQELSKPRNSNSVLKPLIPMLQEKVYGGLTRWELYENTAFYETTNTRRAISDSDDPQGCLPLDESLLKLYAIRWLQQETETCGPAMRSGHIHAKKNKPPRVPHSKASQSKAGPEVKLEQGQPLDFRQVTSVPHA